MDICKHCDQGCLLMTEDTCADCFWDEDAERKRNIRANPRWVFERAYSVAIELFGKSKHEAYQSAILAVKAMK